MNLLDVAINILAIIAIIAVGAFIIVFLSDLLISIIDDHQGIFFRRTAGKEETYIKQNTSNNNYAKNLDHEVIEGLNLDFESTPDKGVDNQKQLTIPMDTNDFNSINLDKAKYEQGMLEKNGNAFLDVQQELNAEENEEEKLQRERVAKLEKRNKELQEELQNQKSADNHIKEFGVKTGEDQVDEFKNLLDDDEEIDTENNEEERAEPLGLTLKDDSEDLAVYESMIKKINAKAVEDLELEQQISKEAEDFKIKAKTDIDALIKETLSMNDGEKELIEKEPAEAEKLIIMEEPEMEEPEMEELIETEDSEEIENDNINDELAEEIEKLRNQLQIERATREKLKLESEQKANNLILEKQKLEEALELVKQEKELRATNVKVVNGSEQEYIVRLEVLQERLKEAKRELRKNKSEFVPLNKIKRTLEADQRKLRRKEARVAKQKIALFGVNNNDIDPEKQLDLEQEIDMLEGLKLSVQHCEDVMKENEDRFPILKNTNDILTENIKDLNTDIEDIEKKLKAIKDSDGNK